VTPDELDGRVAEGWGGEAGANGSHVNVVLARRGSATAATLLGTLTSPRPGHTPILVVVGEDQPSYEPVWPPTIMINKATALEERHQVEEAGAPDGVADVGRVGHGVQQLGRRRVAHDADLEQPDGARRVEAFRHAESQERQAHAGEHDLAIADLARCGDDHQFAERVVHRSHRLPSLL